MIGAKARGGDKNALDYFALAAEKIAEDDVQLISAVGPAADRLTLVVELANFTGADRLLEKLRSAGLDVDVVETRVTDEAARVRSELRITGATTTSVGDQ
jgi:hypothetical protein